MINRYHLLGIILISSMAATSNAMYLLRPYEYLLWPEVKEDFCWQTSLLLEHGFSVRGFNDDGQQVNVLRIWNKEQDALAMLNGFDPLSPIGQLRTKIAANDDGVRGHFLVDGDLNYKAGVGFTARLGLPYHLRLAFYLPFYSMSLHNVRWVNLTKNITADDARVRQYLTNDFFANVASLSGLNLQGWQRSGFGDTTLMLEWLQDFKQNKDFLENVLLEARLGVSFPTGKKTDPEKLFALAFGNDGATALILGGGLTATVAQYVRAGFDVELTHFFSASTWRRIKTSLDQTDLLLLQTAYALKDYGLTQRFDLFVELHHILGNFSGKAGYQFFRHGDDRLSFTNNAFSVPVANTARSLEEWTLHNTFLMASYETDQDCDASAHWYVSAYVRIPFNGQFMTQHKAVGAVFSVDF